MSVERLKKQIDVLDQIVDWVDKNLASTEKTEYLQYLVERRRQIKRNYRSLITNPTIAAYGESQKGKSYVVTSLLNSYKDLGDGEEEIIPLKIKDEKGQCIDFKERINYKTDNQESTGVITRFTTDIVSSDAAHPIKIKVMKLADIITMLSDCFMNGGVVGYAQYSERDLQQMGKSLVERYRNQPVIANAPLIADDVYDICDYLTSCNATIAEPFKTSNWFNNMAMVVRRIPTNKIADEFSCLWFEMGKKDQPFKDLLELVITDLEKIQFAEELYIDTKPVLNNQEDGSVTLMAVLALIDETHGIKAYKDRKGKMDSMVTVKLPSGRQVEVAKALLSLITCEVVYHVDPEHIEEQTSAEPQFRHIKFDTRGIHPSESQTVEQIKTMLLEQNGFKEATNRSFLYKHGDTEDACFDLLDFPGARAIQKTEETNVDSELASLMLREKVYYLFQKYTVDKLISILLLCHDHQNSVSGGDIAIQLSKWIGISVGKDVGTRTERLAEYKASPLFLISTKYNCDLVVSKKEGEEWVMNKNVFQQRFEVKMAGEVIKPKSYTWFKEWTKGCGFENTFLLRDYEYSSDCDYVTNASKIFRGYPLTEKEELHESELLQLKNYFLQQPYVKEFFPNPELAWDAASTMGNDGSYYIYKQLHKVTPNAQAARCNTFLKESSKLLNECITKVLPKFHEDDPIAQLTTSIKNVQRLGFAMRRALNEHEDFFGKFIQHLQMTPNYTQERIISIIPTLNTKVDSGRYEMLIDGVEQRGLHFKKGDEAHNMQILSEVFGITSKDDPLLHGINMDDLFDPQFKNKLSSSYVIVSAIVDEWLDNISSAENNIYLNQIDFSSAEAAEFYKCLRGMVDFIDLKRKLSDAIQAYVNYTNSIKTSTIPIIADITTNIFNAFIMDLGYCYLSREQLDNVRVTNEKFHLQLSFNYEMEELVSSSEDCDSGFDKEVREQLFESLEALGDGTHGQQLSLPAYNNMKRWLEFATIAYVVNFKNQDWGYTKEENDRLGDLLASIN